jgi:hypothetical protein
LQERRRALEFQSFVAGAAGRLLHSAQLLTGEPPDSAPGAERLLTVVLGRTYARWTRAHGEDPYEVARQELISRYAHTAWRYRRTTAGLLGRLGPQERLVIVLRLFEGVAAEQTAAALGLPEERVQHILTHAMSELLSKPREESPAPAPAAAGSPERSAGATA